MSEFSNGSMRGRGSDPATAAMDSLRRVVRSLRASGVASQRDRRVSAAQLFVLRQIREQPGLSMSELANRTVTSQSAVSEVVTRLVGAGLVARRTSPGDHRRAQLSLTSNGEDVLDNSPETIQERLVVGFRSLQVGQQCAIASGLDAWLSAAGLGDVPPSMFLEPVAGEGEIARAPDGPPALTPLTGSNRSEVGARGAALPLRDRRDGTP